MSPMFLTVVRAGIIVICQWFVVMVMSTMGVNIGGSFLPSFTSVFLGAILGIVAGNIIIDKSMK